MPPIYLSQSIILIQIWVYCWQDKYHIFVLDLIIKSSGGILGLVQLLPFWCGYCISEVYKTDRFSNNSFENTSNVFVMCIRTNWQPFLQSQQQQSVAYLELLVATDVMYLYIIKVRLFKNVINYNFLQNGQNEQCL